MPDRYSYPNSLVLINKLGITDYDRWKAVETAAIHQRMVELTEHPIPVVSTSRTCRPSTGI